MVAPLMLLHLTLHLVCPKKNPIFDATVPYNYPYTHKTHILLARNALNVPSIHNNFITYFIVREIGALVNDFLKIHFNYPGVNDHSILFTDSGLKIYLHLWGFLSFFYSGVITHEEITSCDKIFITPNSANWDP